MKKYDSNDPAIMWEPIPEGKDPVFRVGRHPDGWVIKVPRRPLNEEERRKVDELVEHNKNRTLEEIAPPEFLERLSLMAAEIIEDEEDDKEI